MKKKHDKNLKARVALEAIKGVFDSVFYRYARYAIIGFILGYVVPLLFVKLNKIE